MSNVMPSNSDSVKCQVETKFVKHTFDFSWSIEDYPEFPATFCVASPKFHPAKGLSFYAVMDVTDSIDGHYHNDMHICFVQESGDDVHVHHKTIFKDINGKNMMGWGGFVETSHKYKSGCEWSKRFLMYRGRAMNTPSFIFKCKMEFLAPSTAILPKYPMPSPSENFPILVDDLRNMYINSSYADLCLKVGETITLFAHKGILCSRSPVFAKLLESPTDEKEKDAISIKDIELPVVEGFLEFLYTGVLWDDDFDFVYDLYSVANKYDVSSLRKTCTDILLVKLNVENACRVFCLANRHSDVQFKDAVMDFIQFHFDDILETDSWAEFLDEETILAAEVIRSRNQKTECKIEQTDSKTESVECQVKTKFVKHTYDFCWSVEDLPKYPATFCVVSPKFHPIIGLSFYATMTGTGSGNSYDRFDVTFVQESGSDVKASHQISFTDNEGKKLFGGSFKIRHIYESDYKTFCLYRGKEFDQPVLNFNCKMEFHLFSTGIVLKHPLPIPSEISSILVDDLRAMYVNSNCADLSLKVDETITLFAHKGILCSRSPVFAKLLESPMDEKEKNVISIKDIELPIMKGFMEFLYTGVLCNDNFDFVYDLYSAASKYDVSSLRKTCTDILLAKLNVENACRVFCLTNRHSDVQFKDAVMDFIQFHFDDIVETDSWAEFLDEETILAAEVMRIRSHRNKKVNETINI